ncbi:hypothetical protein CKO28_13140 [Rhodovibrio sodomensis]|uniref:FecR protein domain-containing protein n=1 Tax=Rhodovibrio sodomensis TaxID=1088 RepID=A0ABS1DG87_9PROT|nr:FecR domain-containing protein [Rhodovibrio sodomensis]MBK1668976.1 hypothetical protein [Rhodovibrio sodomensis]
MRTFLAAAFAAVLPAAVWLATGPAAAQTDAVGTVTGLTGPASAWTDATPRALTLGARVHRGETLRTLADAKLAVRFTDGSKLTLGADSQAAVDAFAPTRGNAAIRLLRGILRLVTAPASAWRSFEVETRSAVAAARSTEWVVALDAEGATAVFVVSGRVDVRARERSVTLAAGDGTDVPAGEPPGEVKRWRQARVDRVLAATTLP